MDPEFESAVEGLTKMGASVTERELVHLLARHGQEEGKLLERYQRFAEGAASPAVRYLVQLILDDERRHHRLLAEVANTIAWGWSENSPGDATPEILPQEDPGGPLAKETRELLAVEEADRAELRRLRKELRDYEDTTMWALLVDLMLLDTEKHTDILRFILTHICGPGS
jgi:rubrerythrin